MEGCDKELGPLLKPSRLWDLNNPATAIINGAECQLCTPPVDFNQIALQATGILCLS